MATIKDIDLWHEYAKSVKKLDTDELVVTPRMPMPPKVERDGERLIQDYTAALETLPAENGRQPSFRVVKLSRRERKNFMIEATIDIHGSNRNVSPILMDFCLKCIERKVKNIVIISGKGEGVLKNAVAEWLIAHAPIVIGFFEISDASGGSGAFGVRLRSKIAKWL